MKILPQLALLIGIFGLTAGASAQPTLTGGVEFIEMGEPTNGTFTMHGLHGVVVRVHLDGGKPITSIGYPGPPAVPNTSVFGSQAQRWDYSQATGEFTPTPLSTARNQTPDDLNFDSHFLGLPSDYTNIQILGEGYYEGQFSREGLPPSSAEEIYFATSPGPIYGLSDLGDAGIMAAQFELTTSLQSSTLDLAYIVTDSSFVATIRLVSNGEYAHVGKQYLIPEPATCLGLAAAVVFATRRVH